MGTDGLRGFRMPAEWAPHESTWMAWPHDPRTWVAGVDAAEDAYVEMIEAIAPGERVELIVDSSETCKRARARLQERGLDLTTWDASPGTDVPDRDLVRLHVVDHADAWLRDTGPTVVVAPDGRRRAIDWRFDAWGGKYEDLERDDALAQVVAERAGLERVRVDEVLEGGAIDTDGEGTVLTTESCLLNSNRGEGRTRERFEDLLADTIGADQVVWLDQGLTGDDTDGHVDTIARFTAPGRVVACREPDPAHPDHEVLETNLGRLREVQDARGRPLDLETLPMPEPVTWDGRPRPASYANFYIANEAVLLPVYGDERDPEARAILEEIVDRSVTLVDARALVVGFGACHCLTQQIPAPEGR